MSTSTIPTTTTTSTTSTRPPRKPSPPRPGAEKVESTFQDKLAEIRRMRMTKMAQQQQQPRPQQQQQLLLPQTQLQQQQQQQQQVPLLQQPKKKKILINGKPVIERLGDWALMASSTGRHYYFNIKTCCNQWNMPKEWAEMKKKEWLQIKQEQEQQQQQQQQEQEQQQQLLKPQMVVNTPIESVSKAVISSSSFPSKNNNENGAKFKMKIKNKSKTKEKIIVNKIKLDHLNNDEEEKEEDEEEEEEKEGDVEKQKGKKGPWDVVDMTTTTPKKKGEESGKNNGIITETEKLKSKSRSRSRSRSRSSRRRRRRHRRKQHKRRHSSSSFSSSSSSSSSSSPSSFRSSSSRSSRSRSRSPKRLPEIVPKPDMALVLAARAKIESEMSAKTSPSSSSSNSVNNPTWLTEYNLPAVLSRCIFPKAFDALQELAKNRAKKYRPPPHPLPPSLLSSSTGMSPREIQKEMFLSEVRNPNNRYRLLSDKIGNDIIVYKIPDEVWERHRGRFSVEIMDGVRLECRPHGICGPDGKPVYMRTGKVAPKSPFPEDIVRCHSIVQVMDAQTCHLVYANRNYEIERDDHQWKKDLEEAAKFLRENGY